ncbi:RNA-guided endonuclease TnpB family protein [Nocardia sp. NPDC050413]|uniref:RNA-guided endonuclease InsQ/TnpB family protein n=1 Tax=Nocardia sp. NPDC050413 TaxID=3155784 RepID=UPI0033D3B02F
MTCEASDLHHKHHHKPRNPGDRGGWVGIDRGLTVLAVTATAEGAELARVAVPKPLTAATGTQRRLAKAVSRKLRGSTKHRRAAMRLARHHHRVGNIRRHFAHELTNELVKNHDRLVIEGLNVAGMLGNHHLARAISDAGWADLARLLTYKQRWRGGEIAVADRWFPSSKRCCVCTRINPGLRLADRVFVCECGHRGDRDYNAAVNLAQWPTIEKVFSQSPDP